MGKSLVIAEKPSVAADIARALGRVPKHDDHFENDNYVISSAIGHLVELCLPSQMDVKRGKWKLENLPIIPEEFELQPIEKTKSRLTLLKRLMKRPDVTDIINACDAGREGELIFRFLIKISGTNKPIRRLWLQSMTSEAIQEAFTKLRTDEEMMPLAKAAVSRAESDWLVGINSTRALTAFNSKTGGFQLTPAGRVQTPTLAILVEREEKIRSFKPRTYFEVLADFAVKAGIYPGRWFDENFRKGADEDARAERIWDETKARAIEEKCRGKQGTVTEERKATSQASPLLYDLTTLQREANGRFGFSAKRTLQLAQALYEKHKVLTYPRTDSRYLPEDQVSSVRHIMGEFADPTLKVHADKALASGWVVPTKRVFNNAKVTDHNAIIPTGQVPKHLDETEQKIYDMVSRRFIAIFYPAAQFEITTRITRVEGEAFKTEGKIIKDPGWMAVYGREAAEGENSLVEVQPNEKARVEKVEAKRNETKPPARLNEATLLSAMEGAGKTIEDEDLREAMAEKGLGTPATRAAIIEGLLHDGYIARQGRELYATAKGISLITLLRGIGISALCSPELTGEWEFKLKEMEHGRLRRREFMEQIRGLTREIVDKTKGFHGDTVEGNFTPLEVKCPKCKGGPFKEDYRTFQCADCGLRVWKTLAGRELDREEIRTLLTKGEVGPLEGFRSKMGRPFAAKVRLGEEMKPEFDFGDSSKSSGEPVDLTKYQAVGTCPVCKKGQVYALETAYACENSIGGKKECTFRTGRTILQREIPVEQVIKLITTGKTDLLPRFISKKGRPFSAYLKLEKGKVGFEFEPRKPKPKKPTVKVAA